VPWPVTAADAVIYAAGLARLGLILAVVINPLLASGAIVRNLSALLVKRIEFDRSSCFLRGFDAANEQKHKRGTDSFHLFPSHH
jgi:hypothetical protein